MGSVCPLQHQPQQWQDASSDTPAAPLTDEKASQITEKRVNAAKMSYGTSPELHTVCLPIQTGKGKAPE